MDGLRSAKIRRQNPRKMQGRKTAWLCLEGYLFGMSDVFRARIMVGCITRLTCGGTLVVGKRVLNDEIPKRKLVAGFTLCFHRAYTASRVKNFKHEFV